MDSEEGQDGHSLRLHPSHHLHRHADRTQASTIAAFEPCLNWNEWEARWRTVGRRVLHEVCNAHIVSILHIALCLLKCGRGSFLCRQELRPGPFFRQDDSFETRFLQWDVVSEFMGTITESPMNRYCAEVGWALLVFFRILWWPLLKRAKKMLFSLEIDWNILECFFVMAFQFTYFEIWLNLYFNLQIIQF